MQTANLITNLHDIPTALKSGKHDLFPPIGAMASLTAQTVQRLIKCKYIPTNSK